MKLTPEQQAVLDGSKGAVMAKVMKTLVMYGDAFGAEKMVPVTSTYGHTVISFGINAMKPVYDLYDQLIEAGAFSEQKFTADPLPLDKNVPSNPLQDLVFHQFMYKQQATRTTPAPATSTRWATSPSRARCSRGRSRPPWCTPTACSARAATATPA